MKTLTPLKLAALSAAAALPFALSAPAMAQDAGQPEVYVGGQVG